MEYTTTDNEPDSRKVYKNDHWKNSKDFITTNPKLIEMIDKNNKLLKTDRILLNIIKTIFICWLPTLLLFEAGLLIAGGIVSLSCVMVCTIMGIVGITLESKSDQLYYNIIKLYESSDEFKTINKRIQDQKQKEEDARLTEIAKDLVESYAILENDKYSKSKKIKLLKSYIQRSEERHES